MNIETERPTAVISARCTPRFMDMVDSHCQQNGIKKRGDLVIAAVECFMAQGKRSEKIPTAKKKVASCKPLSQHAHARLAVYRVFTSSAPGLFTSSDAAHYTKQSTNNASKRIAELAAEGYLVATGEYRQSRSSGKMLMVWKRSDKPLPEGIEC